MIVAIFFNTYMHTLNNAQYKVWTTLILAKKKGGVSQKLVKTANFLVWQKFLADFSAGTLQNRPDRNLLPN